MVLPWCFRCLLFVVPWVEAARPALHKKCPDAELRKDGKGCECEYYSEKDGHGCKCWNGHVGNNQCTTPGLRVLGFKHEEPEGCRCIRTHEFAELEKIPVEVAAMLFCESAVRETYATYGDIYSKIERWVENHRSGAIELCQGLVANASKQVDLRNPWQSEARRSRKGPESFGRMEPLAGEATSEEDQKDWKAALKHVCHDECVELVNETLEQMIGMVYTDKHLAISPARSCAARVVQKVEAETLGCCARVCGWNNATCLSWPFLSKHQQTEWQAECCSEWNVLKGSSREKMCSSILSPSDAAKASKNDLPEPPNVDTGAVILGQDYTLVWTKKGLQSDLAKKYQSMDPKPEVGKPVDLLILTHEKNLRKKGLGEGWFTEVRLDGESHQQSFPKKVMGWFKGLFKGRPGDPSLLQMAEGSCKAPADMDRCTPTFKNWYFEKCSQENGWQYSRTSEMKAMQCEFEAHDAKDPAACKDNFEKGKEVARYFQFDSRSKGITCRKVTECRKKDWSFLKKLGQGQIIAMNFQSIGFVHRGN